MPFINTNKRSCIFCLYIGIFLQYNLLVNFQLKYIDFVCINIFYSSLHCDYVGNYYFHTKTNIINMYFNKIVLLYRLLLQVLLLT